MSNKESFNFQLKYFKRYFRVIAVDLTGFGASKKMEYAYRLDDYVNEIESLIKSLNVDKVCIVAHSFGARVALKLAYKTNLVEKMVLTGAAGIKPKRSVRYYVKVLTYKLYKKFFKNGNFKGFGSKDYQLLKGVERQSFIYVVNEHLNDILGSIDAKTLIISGDKDTETPPYQQKRLQKGLKNSSIIFLKGEGHFAFVTRYNDFNLLSREFLLGD